VQAAFGVRVSSLSKSPAGSCVSSAFPPSVESRPAVPRQQTPAWGASLAVLRLVAEPASVSPVVARTSEPQQRDNTLAANGPLQQTEMRPALTRCACDRALRKEGIDRGPEGLPALRRLVATTGRPAGAKFLTCGLGPVACRTQSASHSVRCSNCSGKTLPVSVAIGSAISTRRAFMCCHWRAANEPP
jgi:hypothetical protein